MQSRRILRKGNICLLLIGTVLVGTGYAGIYMGTNAGVPSSAQYSSGATQNTAATTQRASSVTYPGVAPLYPVPSCDFVTRPPNNPQSYQPRTRPCVVLPSQSPGVAYNPPPPASLPACDFVTRSPNNPQAYQPRVRPCIVLPPGSPPPPYTPPSTPYRSSSCSGNGQCAQMVTAPPGTTFTPDKTVGGVAPRPVRVAKPAPSMRAYYVTTGSLRSNVNHIVAQSGWGRVVWNNPYDYRWTGDITIQAINVQDALSQLLDQYPVQAVFYEENHVVDIIPRRQA